MFHTPWSSNTDWTLFLNNVKLIIWAISRNFIIKNFLIPYINVSFMQSKIHSLILFFWKILMNLVSLDIQNDIIDAI